MASQVQKILQVAGSDEAGSFWLSGLQWFLIHQVEDGYFTPCFTLEHIHTHRNV